MLQFDENGYITPYETQFLTMNSLDDIKLRVFRLLDLISSTNEAIALHQERGQKGFSAVQQYSILKRRFEDELIEILTNEVGVQFPVAHAA